MASTNPTRCGGVPHIRSRVLDVGCRHASHLVRLVRAEVLPDLCCATAEMARVLRPGNDVVGYTSLLAGPRVDE